ncbi:hypothetical protein ACXX9E_28580 [Pseudomonas sp. GNP014]
MVDDAEKIDRYKPISWDDAGRTDRQHLQGGRAGTAELDLLVAPATKR